MKNIKQTKTEEVKRVFDDVFDKYDLMNDLMSLGIHRVWKNRLIDWMNPKEGDHLIDMASGTGDVARSFLKRIQFEGEVTCVEPTTFNKLKEADASDLYLSEVSPLGVPFNNLRHSVSEEHTASQVEIGDPGSPCPKGFLVSNTEFSEVPICTASKEYQQQFS